MLNPDKEYLDFVKYGITTPYSFEELIQELFKNPNFLKLLREFVQKEINEDFLGRNDIP